MSLGKAKIKIYGVNISKLYKILKSNNIEMENIERIDYKTIYFVVFATKIKKLFAILKDSCYTITVIEYYGLIKYFQFFKKKLGYVIGSVLFLMVLIVSNFFVSSIKIYGNSILSSQTIMDVLKQNGIEQGKLISNIDEESIENLLSNQFEDISLISVIKKGTSIIINIKEKQSINI